MAASDDGGTSGQRTEADDSGEPKLVYTEESYQKGINAVVARERAKAEREAKRVAQDLHATWLSTNGVSEDEALELFAKREVVLAGAEEAQVELATMRRQHAALEKERSEVLTERDRYRNLHRSKLVNEALSQAAVLGKARHPEQVRKLLSDRVRLTEDDQIEVLDTHGEVAHGATVDQMVGDYLAEYTNLVLPSSERGGSGGRPTQGTGSTGNGEPNWATTEGKRQGLREMFGDES